MRYTEDRTAVFYRKSKRDKKKAGKLKKRIIIGSVKVFTVALALFLLVFFGYRTLVSKGFFNVKTVSVIVVNEPAGTVFDRFNEFKGSMIFNIRPAQIKEILSGHYPEYGLRDMTKNYPSSLRIVLYKRMPVIILNDEYAVNNDLTINRAKNTAECVPMKTDIEFTNSGFSIPGLATLMDFIVRNRDDIREIRNKENLFRVIMKDGRNFLLHAGETIVLKKDNNHSDFAYMDIRFNKIILVKN